MSRDVRSVSTLLWWVIPVISIDMLPFIIKAASLEDAYASWDASDYASDWDLAEIADPEYKIMPFDTWCAIRDKPPQLELQYLIGLRDERTIPMGFITLAT